MKKLLKKKDKLNILIMIKIKSEKKSKYDKYK